MTIDDLYDRYLTKKLDLIFNDNGQNTSDVRMFIPKKNEAFTYYSSQEIKASGCTHTSVKNVLDEFPGLEPYLEEDVSAIYLSNGIYGTYTHTIRDGVYYHQCFFPELNMHYESELMEVK